DLQKRLAAAEGRWQQARQLLADAVAIERDLNRLRELREVLPRLQTIAEQSQQVRNSEEKSKRSNAQKQKLTAQLAEQENALEQPRQKRANLQKLLAGEEQRQRDLGARLQKTTGLLTRLKEYEQLEKDLARLQTDLAQLPADPAAAVARARELHEGLTVLAHAVPLLALPAGARAHLCQGPGRGRAA